MRVIITGSRDWIGFKATREIDTVLQELHAFAMALGQDLDIVHGDCPTGADAAADRWGRRREGYGVNVEPYPADWAMYGNRAGPKRNLAMVDAGADMVIAFHRNHSAGTGNCLALARNAKIPTHVVTWNPIWSESSEREK